MRYVAHGRGSTLSLGRSGATLSLQRGTATTAVSIRFAGSNPSSELAGVGRESGVSNYLIGNDPSRWRTGVPRFGGVRYQQLYPGIDVDFHGATDARLEYDVRVAPGADPAAVAIAFDGAQAIDLSPDGSLVLRLGNGALRQPRPIAWQEVGGQRREVSVAYALSGTMVRFQLGLYDPRQALVIDPKVDYASYWGGTGEEGSALVVGRAGNIFLSCGSLSPNLPTVNPIQAYQGGEDVCVLKLDRTGRHIIYATYLGSTTGDDESAVMAVNSQGEVYLSGFATGSDFPTTSGAFDRTFNGGTLSGCTCFGDVFAAKLSADGSRLLYSTFIGGSGPEHTWTMALDHDGSVVLTGFTASADFPTTPGALRRTFGGGSGSAEGVPADAFATKLNASGTALVYSTYLGGSGDDVGTGVAVDDLGNAYLTGQTYSTDFPTTAGALQPSFGGDRDAYVTKLDRRGRLVWSTYLGGDKHDDGHGIAVDASGNVYVSGRTPGDFPITAGAAQTSFGGGSWDLFVAKINRSGSGLVYSTYLGGSGAENGASGLVIDGQRRVYLVDTTSSTNFPLTPDAFQSSNAGGFDIVVVRLDRNGQLDFSSYLGGSGDDDNAGSVPVLDDHGNLFFGGVTSSSDFPVTSDAVQPTFGGGDIDSLILKVNFGRP